MNEGNRVKEFTREEIREIAEETLKAISEELRALNTGMSKEEREVIRNAVEERMGRKRRNEGK